MWVPKFSFFAYKSLAFLGGMICQQVLMSQTPTPSVSRDVPSVRTSVVYDPIDQMTLVRGGTGWAMASNKLLWTTDNGAHWKDISPPNADHDHLASVFFLDASTGWVLLTHQVSDNEHESNAIPAADWTNAIAATHDGGKTWSKWSLTGSSPQAVANLDGVGQIVFVNRNQGWLELHYSMTCGVLFGTIDGGRTWNQVISAPNLAAVISVSPAGNPSLAGIETSGDSKLYTSVDGGRTFNEISLAPPPGSGAADQPTYTAPIFMDSTHGYEAVTFSGGEKDPSIGVLFSTNDGGSHWTADRMLTNLAPSSVGHSIASTVIDSTWIVPSVHQDMSRGINKILPQGRVAVGSQDAGRTGSCRVSFATIDDGWMECGGKLSATSDAGATWLDVTPHARDGKSSSEPLTPISPAVSARSFTLNESTKGSHVTQAGTQFASIPSSGVAQNLGFETTRVPTVANMQIWWNSSPYYVVGVYAPGSPNRGKDLNLTSDWISAVSTQGWGILPIWFGLQAPCATKQAKKVYSSDPTQARADGINQANLAWASVTNNLGLDGSIIYLDMEDFDHSICGSAAQAYLGGFCEQYNALGGAVGVYGGQGNATSDELAPAKRLP